MLQQTVDVNATGNSYTKSEIEEIIVMVRLRLYNRDLPCGAKAIRNHIETECAIDSLPSDRSITRILSRNGLTNKRTGFYDE